MSARALAPADVEAALAARPRVLTRDGNPALSPEASFLEEVREGRAALAADAFLCRCPKGGLSAAIFRLDTAVRGAFTGDPASKESLVLRRFLYEGLLELGLCLGGRDAADLGHGAEADTARARTAAILDGLEREEASLFNGGALAGRVASRALAAMKSVNAGDSLVGLLAEEVEKAVPEAPRLPSRIIEPYAAALRATVYWRMVDGRLCKFGNDYARGLDHLRRLGFVQVSTNPVLAAKAFDEDPDLLVQFKEEAARRPEWGRDPEGRGDEMAMAATLLALWPNLTVFRPLGARADLSDYMVSFQLNPNIADDAKASLEDAERAHALAADFLRRYDTRLLPAAEAARGTGPNLVFKVAGCGPAAREITRSLNARGMGTNNTVVYSVAQEIRLILDAFEGKAEAARAGRPIPRTYETNMGGRLVSHLREVEAEKALCWVASNRGEAEARRRLLDLAAALKVDEKTRLAAASDGAFPKEAERIASFKFLKSLDHPAFLEAVKGTGLDPARPAELEAAIRKAGTMVARRVYRTFFAPANRPRWTAWLGRAHGVSAADAGRILDSMDCLPASKRIPEDTFHTLGFPNQTNTEFPNHARAVEGFANRPGFRLEACRDSLLHDYDASSIKPLFSLPDFAKAYDVTPGLKAVLAEAGIEEARGFGEGGIGPEVWPAFGPVRKTLAEFKGAYDGFVKRLREAIRG